MDVLPAENEPWMHLGYCADSAYPDMWFPTEMYESASYCEELCGGCPVRLQCLRYAMERPELEGVWGGVSAHQRKEIRREMNLPKPSTHGTYGGYLRHRRNNEEACADCKTACAERSRRKRQQLAS